eukprot:gene5825-9648_t
MISCFTIQEDISNFIQLSDDCLFQIFLFLQTKDILKIQKVSKEFFQILIKNNFWWIHDNLKETNIFNRFNFNYLNYLNFKFNFSEKRKIKNYTGIKPSPRFRHTLTLFKNKIIIIGGDIKGVQTESGVFIYDIVNKNFIEKYIANKPLGISKHTANLYSTNKENNSILIFGGIIDYHMSNSLYSLNLNNFEWRKLILESNNSIPKFKNHISILRNDELFIFFGYKMNHRSNQIENGNIYKIDLKNLKFEKIKTIGIKPKNRIGSTYQLLKDKENVLFFGGGIFDFNESWNEYYHDILIFNLKSYEWKTIEIDSFHYRPLGSTFCSSFLFKEFFFIFGGGYKGNKVSNKLSILNLVEMKWIKPNSRIQRKFNLIGDSMETIIWNDQKLV